MQSDFSVKLAIFLGTLSLLILGPAFFGFIPKVFQGIRKVIEALFRVFLFIVLVMLLTILIYGVFSSKIK